MATKLQDMSTPRLKRYYLKSLKSLWYYQRAQEQYSFHAKTVDQWAGYVQEAKVELARRGWKA